MNAVRCGRVYKAPPWSTWSPRLAPIALWMASKAYPERFRDVNIDAVTDVFFRNVFHIPFARVHNFAVLETAFILATPFLAAFFSLFVGAYGISPGRIPSVLGSALSGADSPEGTILLDIRLPRIILAGLAGLALSTSGAALQAVLRNPLVDPFILGISSGAAFGCALTLGFASAIPIQVAAFLGGRGRGAPFLYDRKHGQGGPLPSFSCAVRSDRFPLFFPQWCRWSNSSLIP